MARRLGVVSALAVSLLLCGYAQAQSQDPASASPSLGDIARQAKKDKAADRPAAKVFTNEDMSTGASTSPSAPGTASGKKAQPAANGDTSEIQTPAEGMDRLQSALDELASLDRRSLADNVLGGNEANFPGRAEWEQKLFAAKEAFVEQTRLTLQKAKEIAVSGQAIKDAQDVNDPRVKSISAKLDQLVQETQRNRAAFQTVVDEGKALAGESGGR